jgi:hypothetical protein
LKWLSTIKISLNINEHCNKEEVDGILETKGKKGLFKILHP